MIEILIIADDFTGALDTGVQFSQQGYRTAVTTVDPPSLAGIAEDIQVLVVDTESRHLNPASAYARTYGWISHGKDSGQIPIFYKKTDSTMRGNIGAELEAALAASGREKLLFVPAFPRMGRTVSHGEVYVGGALLTATEFANDPFTPVSSNCVAEIIQKSAPCLPVAVATPSSLLSVYYDTAPGTVIVVDAQTDTQLQEIALSMYALRKRVVFAGCAGFAQVVPCMLGQTELTAWSKPSPRSCLMVCGSVNQVAMKQIRYAEHLGVRSVLLQPHQYLESTYWDTPEGREFFRALLKEMREHKCVILKTSVGEESLQKTRRFAASKELALETLHLQIADRLGRLTAELVNHAGTDLLCVFGGDTLHGVLQNLQIQMITPEREIFPGVVHSVLHADGMQKEIVSKAGGFGSKTLIASILQHYQLMPEAAAAT